MTAVPAPSGPMPILSEPLHVQLTDIHKSFSSGRDRRKALHGIDLSVRRREVVALLGASGSGKSTLLRTINGLHTADAQGAGRVEINGQVLQEQGHLAPNVREIRSTIATIFQQFNLVNRLKVLTNVCVGALHEMPLWRSYTGLFSEEIRLRALNALRLVGIMDQAYKRARLLSGGQQQRVAIARAITQGAQLILADEPIASLDPESSRKVMEMLVSLNQDHGCTVIVSLHQVAVALKYCQRVVALKDGHVVFDGPAASLSPDQLKDLYGSECDLIFDELEAPLSAADLAPNSSPVVSS